MGATFKVDTREFKAAIREYEKVSKREMVTILNTKGFYIARGAVRETKKTSPQKIQAELRQLFQGKHVLKATVTRYTRWGKQYEAPLVALLINFQRGLKDKKGLYGKAMAAASRKWVGARMRSVAAIAAGFLPAVRGFEKLAEKKSQAPALDKGVKQYGKPKGDFKAAQDNTWRPYAAIINTASFKGDKKGALEHYGGRGLAEAFNKEIRSMRQYMTEKFAATAKKFSKK